MADITITEGDTLEVDYNLENTGDGTGTFDPRLLVQGVQEDQDTGITLDPAQTATGTLSWPTQAGDAVTDAVAEAVTDDTSDSITVTVEEASAIPDSVVTRPDDDRTFTNTKAFGVRISVSQEWPDIGAEISQNPSGFTRAYVYDVSDGTLMGDVDISALTAGNTFTVGLDSPLQSGNSYNFVVDAEGGSFTQGSKRNANFPFTGGEGNLEIVNGAKGATGPSGDAVNLLRVGDVGF